MGASVKVTHGGVGILAGSNRGTISNCNTSGNVEGENSVGGLVGRNRGTIENSSSKGTVKGSRGNVGGLVGHHLTPQPSDEKTGIIRNSYSESNVEGRDFVGGLVGWQEFAIIINSHAKGEVRATQDFNGGLVGYSFAGEIIDSYAITEVIGADSTGGLVGYLEYNSSIINSYARGKVAGTNQVGGLVGTVLSWSGSVELIRQSYADVEVTGVNEVGGLVGDFFVMGRAIVEDSYARGTVSGANRVGGLVGRITTMAAEANITNSYAVSEVTGSGSDIDGLVGQNTGGTITNSYFNTDLTSGGVGIGRTTLQMKQKDSFNSWNFTSIWNIYENHTYPFLRWQSLTDKDLLLSKINEAQGLIVGAVIGSNPGQHPQSAVDDLQTAIDAAKLVLQDHTVSQGIVDGEVVALQAAIDAFNNSIITQLVDKSNLTNKINEAQGLKNAAVIGSNPGQYPQSAVVALQAAIDTANTVLQDNTVSQVVVDTAVVALQAAINTFNNSVVPQPVHSPDDGGAGGGSGGGSAGGGNSTTIVTPQEPIKLESVSVILVNNREVHTGKETVYVENGNKIVKVEINEDMAIARIREILAERTEGTTNLLTIPVVTREADKVTTVLTSNILQKMVEEDFKLSIQTENIQFMIPAEEISHNRIAEVLGLPMKRLREVTVEVTIENADDDLATQIREKAITERMEVMAKPVSFRIEVTATMDNGDLITTRITSFNQYLQRTIEIPEGIDVSKITTAVIYEERGAFYHIPTEVFQENGRWYARINSLKNSTYVLVWNPIVVESVERHWSRHIVNDMASRLVIKNPETFLPNGYITRGEFAQYITKALGLYRTEAAKVKKFRDVELIHELADAITIASEYGIINGYPDGTFRPDAKITREEAMTMYARAMDIAGLTKIDENRINGFQDKELISDWAYEKVKKAVGARVFNGRTHDTIDPKGTFTYAEAATAIRNLLIGAKLINK